MVHATRILMATVFALITSSTVSTATPCHAAVHNDVAEDPNGFQVTRELIRELRRGRMFEQNGTIDRAERFLKPYVRKWRIRYGTYDKALDAALAIWKAEHP